MARWWCVEAGATHPCLVEESTGTRVLLRVVIVSYTWCGRNSCGPHFSVPFTGARGVFATWIDVVRRCKIIFLPTISSNFCLVPQLGPQKGAKSALRGHQPIDFRPFRTPSRGIAAFSHHGHFSPHNCSKLDTAIGKRSTRYVYAKRILSVMSDGSPVRVKER